MAQDPKLKLPIGYWLKQADNLLTERINKAQAVHGVTRSEWQVLNLLKEKGGAAREEVFETMRTFVDSSSLDQILSGLTERGWVELKRESQAGTELFELTESGRQQHAAILATQKEVRQQAMRGISQEEYATVIRVLGQIVDNLSDEKPPAEEPAPPTPKTLSNTRLGITLSYPDPTPLGRPVKVTEKEADNGFRVHLTSEGSSEVYFEVGKYPRLTIEEAIELFKTGVAVDVGDVVFSPVETCIFASRQAWYLTASWSARERRAVFIAHDSSVYRIIYDPQSEINHQILRSLAF